MSTDKHSTRPMSTLMKNIKFLPIKEDKKIINLFRTLY